MGHQPGAAWKPAWLLGLTEMVSQCSAVVRKAEPPGIGGQPIDALLMCDYRRMGVTREYTTCHPSGPPCRGTVRERRFTGAIVVDLRHGLMPITTAVSPCTWTAGYPASVMRPCVVGCRPRCRMVQRFRVQYRWSAWRDGFLFVILVEHHDGL